MTKKASETEQTTEQTTDKTIIIFQRLKASMNAGKKGELPLAPLDPEIARAEELERGAGFINSR